ncbi:MAG: 2,3-bisphosphoglycerate-independent phosphoglycerate mutase [Halobacteriaceae archaeon]
MEVALVILDGWGIAPPEQSGRDAVADAATPNVDELAARGVAGRLRADGRAVGLPEGQMGNSEVGHLTIGAGRAIPQPYTRIEDAIEAGRLAGNAAVADLLEYASAGDRRLHLVGLVSDGGVHADHEHMAALIRAAADRGVAATTHAITDGRDTAPTAAEGLVASLERVAAAAGTGEIATVTGRYYAMDRDENWDRTYRAYRVMVEGVAEHEASSGVEAVQRAYDREETDEFISPTLVDGGPTIEADDAVFVCNFRADRARQLVRMLANEGAEWASTTDPPPLRIATMTEYDDDFPFPVAFPPRHPETPLGAVFAAADWTQLRVAESEKYAHVTYFLNGGQETLFEGEHREIVPSPDVATYDQQPEMAAPFVTDRVLERLGGADEPDALVVNYANPDMVGHTGDYAAAVEAVEAVDREVGRLVPALRTAGADVIVTADHGNADNMGAPDAPHTAHTSNPVPLLYSGPSADAGDVSIDPDGSLADVAPTLLAVGGLSVPETMTGTMLFD